MIDPSSLAKALQQLETSLAYLRSDTARRDPPLRTQFRAAAIQAFEFTYELAIRMIRRALAEQATTTREINTAHFYDLMRMAADAELVSDPRRYRHWREKRNITNHSYDEARAEQVVSDLDQFVADIRFLLAELERRNRA